MRVRMKEAIDRTGEPAGRKSGHEDERTDELADEHVARYIERSYYVHRYHRDDMSITVH